jgi:hypothetical protein
MKSFRFGEKAAVTNSRAREANVDSEFQRKMSEATRASQVIAHALNNEYSLNLK